MFPFLVVDPLWQLIQFGTSSLTKALANPGELKEILNVDLNNYLNNDSLKQCEKFYTWMKSSSKFNMTLAIEIMKTPINSSLIQPAPCFLLENVDQCFECLAMFDIESLKIESTCKYNGCRELKRIPSGFDTAFAFKVLKNGEENKAAYFDLIADYECKKDSVEEPIEKRRRSCRRSTLKPSKQEFITDDLNDDDSNRKFECSMCNLVFGSQNWLTRHNKKAHAEESIPDDKSDDEFESKEDVSDDDSNRKFECTVCNLVFLSKNWLTRHNKKAHADDESIPDTKSDKAIAEAIMAEEWKENENFSEFCDEFESKEDVFEEKELDETKENGRRTSSRQSRPPIRYLVFNCARPAPRYFSKKDFRSK